MTRYRLLPVLVSAFLVAPLAAQSSQGSPGSPEAVAEEQPAATTVPVDPPVDEATAAAIRHEGIENSHAMAMLEEMCTTIGHRLTGSDNFTKACYWALEKFQEMGLDAHLEKWDEWNIVWNRGVWEGRVVEPIEMDLFVATEAWTAGTEGTVRGRLVRIPEDEAAVAEVADRLQGVFVFGRKPRGAHEQALIDAGVAGIVYGARGDAKYPTRVRVFGNSRVARGSIDNLPKVPEIAVRSDHAKELDNLLDESADGGESVVVEFNIENSFRKGPIALHNVIAEIKGTEKPDEVVIVCGHLDSWHQAQGTTDNGTGTNSTMEAARILSVVGAKPKRTIRFCLWGGEEQGLLGSRAYVQKHRSEMDKVSAVFNHDTGTNWAYSLSVSEKMYGPMQAVMKPVMALAPPDEDHDGPVFKLNQVEAVRGGGGSDHASFIAAGVPGLNWGLKGRSDYFGYTWHTQWDTIDAAIPEYQKHTSTVIALAALGTANLPELLDRSAVQRGGRRQAGSIAQALFGAEMEEMTFTKVEKDGKADKMGVQKGDVIEAVNGKKISQLFEIFMIMRDDQPEELVFTLKRGDGKAEARIKTEDLTSGMRRGRRNRDGDGDGDGEGEGRRGGEQGGQRQGPGRRDG